MLQERIRSIEPIGIRTKKIHQTTIVLLVVNFESSCGINMCCRQILSREHDDIWPVALPPADNEIKSGRLRFPG